MPSQLSETSPADTTIVTTLRGPAFKNRVFIKDKQFWSHLVFFTQLFLQVFQSLPVRLILEVLGATDECPHNATGL